MKIKPIHPNFVMPIRSTESTGLFDLYMPVSGAVSGQQAKSIGLGFEARVPAGHVALIFPRQALAAQLGVELSGAVSVVTEDCRGEWKASIKTKGNPFRWEEEDRVLQFMVVPITVPVLELVDEFELE